MLSESLPLHQNGYCCPMPRWEINLLNKCVGLQNVLANPLQLTRSMPDNKGSEGEIHCAHRTARGGGPNQLGWMPCDSLQMHFRQASPKVEFISLERKRILLSCWACCLLCPWGGCKIKKDLVVRCICDNLAPPPL